MKFIDLFSGAGQQLTFLAEPNEGYQFVACRAI